MEYVDGITIIDTSGIIRFSIKFDPCWTKSANESIVGKKLLDIFSELNCKTSTLFQCMERGVPIRYSNQKLDNSHSGQTEIEGVSYPIKISGNIVGAVEISRQWGACDNLPCKEPDIKDMLLRVNVDFSNCARYSLDDIICRNKTMQEKVKYARTIANSGSPVFILGQTGTGKELFAHGIHNASDRKGRPFIVQNCSAIPESLLESILFGTCKGSFTGAIDRKGIFEIADGGTLFLDEVNSMPMQLQAKLLRVLQDGFVRRVGAENEKRVNVRIIAAANVEYDQVLSGNIIRQDLFYRLSVLVIQIPALKDRGDDILPLIEYFIKKYNTLQGKSVKGITDHVRDIAINYQWPGNIRELENVIEASMNPLNSETELICYNDLPDRYKAVATSFAPIDLKSIMETTEKNIISKALLFYNGNVSETARALQLPRQTLQEKINKHKITILP